MKTPTIEDLERKVREFKTLSEYQAAANKRSEELIKTLESKLSYYEKRIINFYWWIGVALAFLVAALIIYYR